MPGPSEEAGPVDRVGGGRTAQHDDLLERLHRVRRPQELDVVGVEEVGDGEQQLRLGPVEDVRRLRALEPGVERDDDPARGVDTERGVHPLGGVRRPDRDPVAGFDPGAISARGGDRRVGELGEGDPLPLVDERFDRRVLARGTLDDTGDGSGERRRSGLGGKSEVTGGAVSQA